jgi:hypothetical protein
MIIWCFTPEYLLFNQNCHHVPVHVNPSSCIGIIAEFCYQFINMTCLLSLVELVEVIISGTILSCACLLVR